LPLRLRGYCKHVIALLLSYAHEPESFALRKEPAELLSELSREQLLALLTRLLGEQPDLYELIEAALAAPSVSGSGKIALSRRREMDVEVYRRRVSSIMHGLDHMRASEAYWHVGGLTDELRGVERSAREFLDAGEAEAALRILLTLLEESSDGFEYLGWPKLKLTAMSSLEKFYDKRPLAEVLVEEQEWDAVIRLADRRSQEHEVAAIVADALITRRPEWVIRASVKHAEALIAPTKSSLYPAAADWLRRAKAAYAHSGQADEWEQYLQQLRGQYKRRPALMARLTSL